MRLVVQAAASISLKQHQATHPRLGAIDHVVCQYLPSEGEGAEAAAVAVAHDIAAKVSEGLPTLPVVLYGAACGHRRRLQDIRRACGALKVSQGILAAILLSVLWLVHTLGHRNANSTTRRPWKCSVTLHL